jgi:hypothetical protein
LSSATTSAPARNHATNAPSTIPAATMPTATIPTAFQIGDAEWWIVHEAREGVGTSTA